MSHALLDRAGCFEEPNVVVIAECFWMKDIMRA
jgi:hypothetical protein